MQGGILAINDKGEVTGNLVAGVLSGRGVGFLSIGEYFEAKPLVEVIHPDMIVKSSTWIDGVAYRILDVGSIELRDVLAAHGDALVYVISNSSGAGVKLTLAGGLQAFSWFNPDFRMKISKMANVEFKPTDGYGLRGSYGGVYHFYLASNNSMKFQVHEDRAEFTIEMEIKRGNPFILTICGATQGAEAENQAKQVLANPSKVERDVRDEVMSILRGLPAISESKPEYQRLWDYMWYVLLMNRAKVSNHPILQGHFTMPSKFVFRHQWLWDSAFHAIILSEHDVRLAEEELSNLFIAQKPDGRIPHEIFISKEFCSLFWNVDDYSPWTTQPPVMAIAVKYVMQKGGSEGFLKKAFEALDRYDRWFRMARDSDGDQLIAYVDYLESGWDNAVRWDEATTRFEKAPSKYRRQYPEIRMAPVEAIDLNCYIYIQRQTLADIAERIGLKESAGEYRKLARETSEGIRRLMWDPSEGFYFDVLEEGHEKIKVKTPAAFATLYAGIASREEAGELVRRLMSPAEFWTRFPLPTVSADDPQYDSKGYWRGRSWINQIWFTFWGLRDYGFDTEARALADRVLDIMAKGPTCNENYDSATGEPLGSQDFGWSTLMLTIMKDIHGS